MSSVKCHDTEGRCFARASGMCSILSDNIKRTPCPFKKPRKMETNGHVYPYNRYMAVEKEIKRGK